MIEEPVGSEDPEDIFQLIAHQNGPLLDYHPTVLAQCLLWGKSSPCQDWHEANLADKLSLVKEILLSLRQCLLTCEEDGSKRVRFERKDPLAFVKRSSGQSNPIQQLAPKYDTLFDTATDAAEDEDRTSFTQAKITDLIERLEDDTIYVPLLPAEKSMLSTIAQATVEVEEQRRSLDICGLRYLISIRMFVNYDRLAGRVSGTATPSSIYSVRPRQRLSFRNIVWASHSESEDVLLSASIESCENGKMIWEDAKRLGVFLWLRSAETAVSHRARRRGALGQR
jgi:hypothetical protein